MQPSWDVKDFYGSYHLNRIKSEVPIPGTRLKLESQVRIRPPLSLPFSFVSAISVSCLLTEKESERSCFRGEEEKNDCFQG